MCKRMKKRRVWLIRMDGLIDAIYTSYLIDGSSHTM